MAWCRWDTCLWSERIYIVQVGLQTADFPLVLENSLLGIAGVESLETLHGRSAWGRLMLDFLLYASKGKLDVYS